MTDDEVRAEIDRASREWYHKGCEMFHIEERPLLVRFDVRGVDGGRANAFLNYVNYNMVLARENFDDYIAQTVPHEVAHLIANVICPTGRAAHGPYWKRVMRMFGKEPNRTHHYDVTHARVRNLNMVTAVCLHCNTTFRITKRKAERLQKVRALEIGTVTCGFCKHKNTIVIQEQETK